MCADRVCYEKAKPIKLCFGHKQEDADQLRTKLFNPLGTQAAVVKQIQRQLETLRKQLRM